MKAKKWLWFHADFGGWVLVFVFALLFFWLGFVVRGAMPAA